MGPCTTAWFHSDWSSKVGPHPFPESCVLGVGPWCFSIHLSIHLPSEPYYVLHAADAGSSEISEKNAH